MLFVFIVPIINQAQEKTKSIGFRFGATSNYSLIYQNDISVSPYFEINYNDQFFSPSLDWILVVAYWNDFINKPLPIADYATRNYSSYILGVRIKAKFRKLFKSWSTSPINIELGVSQHFVSGEVILDELESDVDLFITYIDLGFGLDILVGKSFILNPKIMVSITNKENQYFEQMGVAVLSIGLNYQF